MESQNTEILGGDPVLSPLPGTDSARQIIVDSTALRYPLGLDSSPLYGLVQYSGVWMESIDDPEIAGVRAAYDEILADRWQGDTQTTAHYSSRHQALREAAKLCLLQQVKVPLADDPESAQIVSLLDFDPGWQSLSLVKPVIEIKPSRRNVLAETNPVDVREWIRVWSTIRIARPDRQPLSPPDFHLVSHTVEFEILTRLQQELESVNNALVIFAPLLDSRNGDNCFCFSIHFQIALLFICRNLAAQLIVDESNCAIFPETSELFSANEVIKTIRNDSDIDPVPNPDVLLFGTGSGHTVVRSQYASSLDDQFQNATLVRSYIETAIIDQFNESFDQSQEHPRLLLLQYPSRFPQQIRTVRIRGQIVELEFINRQSRDHFVTRLASAVVIAAVCGQERVRLFLNLRFRPQAMDMLFRLIDALLIDRGAEISGADRDPDAVQLAAENLLAEFASPPDNSVFHVDFVDLKRRAAVDAQPADSTGVKQYLERQLKEIVGGQSQEIVLLDSDSYSHYRDQIEAMQQMVYEPARQTSMTKFDELIDCERFVAILVIDADDRIMAMSFAGPLRLFPGERGTSDDPHSGDPRTLYMLDLTVEEEYRGKLGGIMKRATALRAIEVGAQAIHGRNRDHLARGMWAINLSLGSYVTQLLKDDYQDDLPYRDCFYYRCPISWPSNAICLSTAVDSILDPRQIDREFIEQGVPTLLLGNVPMDVNDDSLQKVDFLKTIFPGNHQHLLGFNSPSDALEWIQSRILGGSNSSASTGRSMVAVGGFSGLFGRGDMSVELHEWSPDEAMEFLDRMNPRRQKPIAVFVEPLRADTLERIPREKLLQMQQACRRLEIPLVFDESGGSFFRYSADTFAAGQMDGCEPDISILQLAGRNCLVSGRASILGEDPSGATTCSINAYSLFALEWAVQSIGRDFEEYLRTMTQFDTLLKSKLAKFDVDDQRIDGGVGWFTGDVPNEFARLFCQSGDGRFLCCPTIGNVRKFLHEHI